MERRLVIVGLLFTLSLLLVFTLMGPVAQDPDYHQFADQQTWLGIPHFWQVVSSGLITLSGLYALWRMPSPPVAIRWISRTFFLGLVLTGMGSAYYHLDPTTTTLFWDRLPMSIAFMAFFSLVVAMQVDERLAGRLFLPLLMVGMGSVIYWGVSEQMGRGDLRLYGVVQYLPMLLIPIILLLYRSARCRLGFWLVLLLYAVAKLAELGDEALYTSLGISGHVVKHLLAAVVGVVVLKTIVCRYPSR